MSYNRITWLPDVLRAAGIEVVLYDGWKSRGLSTSQRYEPTNVVWHHDASAPGDSPSVPQSMINRFSTAAAQVWIDRRGRWHVIASGRAPHAGKVRSGAPSNFDSIGIETDHTTGEAWPPALVSSLRRGTAAILRHVKRTPDQALHFHKSICDPPGRKVDPDGLNLASERATVKSLLTPVVVPPKSPTKPPAPLAGEVIVRHAHTSSRFDRSPETLAFFLRKHAPTVDLITVTEVSAEKREASLRKVGDALGFGVVTGDKGGMDDCGIMYRLSRFSLAAKGTEHLSSLKYDAPGGGITYAAWAVLTHGSHRLLVVVAHLPSGVERSGGLRGSAARVKKWRADQKALRALWNKLAAEYDATAILVQADWNVDYRKATFRALFKAVQPGMTATLNPKALPKAGTYGTRLIDIAFIRGRIKVTTRPVIQPLGASSDHRAFRQRLTLTLKS